MSLTKKFEDYLDTFLPAEYLITPLTRALSQKRTQAIYALIIQIFSSLSGFSFFFLRRVVLYLIVNTFSLTLTIIGFLGVLEIKKWYIIAHALLTTGILGTCFLYSLLEIFLRREEELRDKHISENTIMFLMSLPYLVDFCSGCFTFYFASLLLKSEQKNDFDEEDHQKMLDNMQKNQDICVICSDEKRNVIFYKCGHKITCMKCASRLKAQFNPLKCPFCRQNVVDIIRTYEDL